MVNKRVNTATLTPDEIAQKGLARICREGDSRALVEQATLKLLLEKYGDSAVDAVVSPWCSPRQEPAEELTAPEIQALQDYEQQFENLKAPEPFWTYYGGVEKRQIINKPQWNAVRDRLLADGKNKLRLAMALESTVIFEVWYENGQVLFADGGREVPESTMKKTYYKIKADIKGKYELFTAALMCKWEQVTGRHFVETTSSYIESDDLLPSNVRKGYLLQQGYVYISTSSDPKEAFLDTGARRYLIV